MYVILEDSGTLWKTTKSVIMVKTTNSKMIHYKRSLQILYIIILLFIRIINCKKFKLPRDILDKNPGVWLTLSIWGHWSEEIQNLVLSWGTRGDGQGAQDNGKYSFPVGFRMSAFMGKSRSSTYWICLIKHNCHHVTGSYWKLLHDTVPEPVCKEPPKL